MLCALFNSHLLLAAPDSGSKHFVVKAVLNTADLDIANAHEGPGEERCLFRQTKWLSFSRPSLSKWSSLLETHIHNA